MAGATRASLNYDCRLSSKQALSHPGRAEAERTASSSKRYSPKQRVPIFSKKDKDWWVILAKPSGERKRKWEREAKLPSWLWIWL